MPLLIDADGEAAERWRAVGPDEALPRAGAVLVAPERAEEAVAAGLTLGLAVPNDTPVAALEPWFDRAGLIAIAFPSFADGRGFSIAAQLRQRGYAGRLRAQGPVIADQFRYLLACGFDEVEIPDTLAQRQPIVDWMAALGRFRLIYQRGRRGRASIADARSGTHA